MSIFNRSNFALLCVLSTKYFLQVFRLHRQRPKLLGRSWSRW